MTQKTQWATPVVPMFEGGPTASPYFGLNNDPLFHQLAAQIDGGSFDDLQYRLGKLLAWRGFEDRPRIDAAEKAAITAAVEDGDMDAAWAPVAQLLQDRQFEKHAHSIHTAAITKVRYEADTWLRDDLTQDQFAKVATEHLQAIVAEAAPLVPVVAGARSFEAIGVDADRAQAFARLSVIAEQWSAAIATVQAVVAPRTGVLSASQVDPNRWSWAWLWADYTAVWPTFWRRDVLVEHQPGNRKDRELPAVAVPWETMTPLDVLTTVVERNLQILVASRKLTATRSERLDLLAEKARDKELANPTNPDWETVSGTPLDAAHTI